MKLKKLPFIIYCKNNVIKTILPNNLSALNILLAKMISKRTNSYKNCQLLFVHLIDLKSSSTETTSAQGKFFLENSLTEPRRA